MNTLDLDQAAQFLRLNPSTLQARAKAGIISGAKIGREWVFIEDDLVAYIRSQYPANKGTQECHSTKSARRGTPTSSTKAGEFAAALDLPTAKKRSASMTNSKPSFGEKPTLRVLQGAPG